MTKHTFALNPELAPRILKSYLDFISSTVQQADKFFPTYIAEVQKLNPEMLTRLLESCFQSSLVKEEGKHHRFSIYVSPPEEVFSAILEPYAQKHFCGYFTSVISFENRIQISALPKIAPAFDSIEQKLRVWFNSDGEIEIWGFGKNYFDDLALEVRTFSMGQLLIHVKPLDFPRERFLLTGSRAEKVASSFSLIPLLFSQSDLEKLRNTQDKENWVRLSHRVQRRHGFLIDVINKMSSHGNGGTLLLVPGSDSISILRDSIKEPIPYKPAGGFDLISRRMLDEENEHVYSYKTQKPNSSLPWSFEKRSFFLGQLTAVDGATVVTTDFDVLAIGAKIKELGRPDNTDESTLKEVWIEEPFDGKLPVSKKISEFGGTRHQSAAHFVFDQRAKSVFAIVASQDGRVSIIFWDKVKERVTVIAPAEYIYSGLKFST